MAPVGAIRKERVNRTSTASTRKLIKLKLFSETIIDIVKWDGGLANNETISDIVKHQKVPYLLYEAFDSLVSLI
jgi:hypothetical protein